MPFSGKKTKIHAIFRHESIVLWIGKPLIKVKVLGYDKTKVENTNSQNKNTDQNTNQDENTDEEEEDQSSNIKRKRIIEIQTLKHKSLKKRYH